MINIFIKLKSIGKRKSAFKQVPYLLPDNIKNLSELITAVVNIEVERYSSRETEILLLPFLMEEEIEDQCLTGKVGFGRIYSDKKADLQKAISVAIQGFEDGLFRVLINDTEVKSLDTLLELKDGDIITFIRLVFLTGRLW